MPGPSPLQSQQAVFDRLNCSKDMKLLKGAGHFPIEKEGLVHLERYCVEFLEECLARHCVSGFQ